MEEEVNVIVSQALYGMCSHASVPRSVPTAAPRAPPALVTSIRGMVDEVEAGLRSPLVSPGAVRAHDSDVGFGEEKSGGDEEDTVGGMLSAMERELGGSKGRRRQVRSGEGVYPAMGWDGDEGRWGEVGEVVELDHPFLHCCHVGSQGKRCRRRDAYFFLSLCLLPRLRNEGMEGG